jgi:Rieske Fe-S protein
MPLKVEGNTFAGESVINFSLPNGVKWDRSAASKIEAYGVSIQDSEALEVQDLKYELTDRGAFIKLNLKNPIDSGNYEFYLEGVMLADGSVVDRPYHARVQVGS